MKKIFFALRILLGGGLIFFAAVSLSGFGGVLQLVFGTVLMLCGVLCGFLLSGRGRWFWGFAAIYGALVFFLAGPVQYFAGGYIVYFGCYLIFDKNSLHLLVRRRNM